MDAVIACDRLARTVIDGSVERVVEEVIERGAPIPQHAQHLRVLVRDASLGPSRYRECYAREGGPGRNGLLGAGTNPRGRMRIGYADTDR